MVSSIVQKSLVLIQRRLEPGFSHIERRGEVINQVMFDDEKSRWITKKNIPDFSYKS